DGCKSSICLEDAFWSSLKEIAHAERATVSELVAKIDKTRKQANLSSAVRLFVLDRVRNGQMGKSGLGRSGRTRPEEMGRPENDI
ncbi:MAG: ribbon-helix-helix domain-containing protein, partial [Pseudolabrys sp.]